MLYTNVHVFNVYCILVRLVDHCRFQVSKSLMWLGVVVKVTLNGNCFGMSRIVFHWKNAFHVGYHVSDFPKDHVAVMHHAVSTTFLVLAL